MGFTFNIMDAAAYGYVRFWHERYYLLKLALVPAIIKCACMVTIFAFGYETDILKQGLILLPAQFAEGWMLAQVLRTILLEERWPTILPEKPDEITMARLMVRARGIIAATLVYVLISLFGTLTRYFIFGEFGPDSVAVGVPEPTLPPDSVTGTPSGSVAEGASAQAPANPIYYIPAIALILTFFWFSRLLWIYIPYAVLMPAQEYLKAIAGFMSSVRFIALFLSTMMPIMLLAFMVINIVANFIEPMGSAGETIGQFFSIVVSVASETSVALVATIALAWAMQSFLPHTPTAFKDLPVSPKK